MELKVKNLTESPFQAKQNWRKLAEKVRKFTENHTHKMCHVGSFWVKTKINITWEMGLKLKQKL